MLERSSYRPSQAQASKAGVTSSWGTPSEGAPKPYSSSSRPPVLGGSRTRRYESAAVAISHLIKQPYSEAEGGRIPVPEFQVNNFPNVQTSRGLEADAGFADVGADPLSGNLVQQALVSDTHGHMDLYPGSPMRCSHGRKSSRPRGKVLRNCAPHCGVIGNKSDGL